MNSVGINILEMRQLSEVIQHEVVDGEADADRDRTLDPVHGQAFI